MIKYVTELNGLKVDQVRRSGLGGRYRIVAIETTGYVIIRDIDLITNHTTRIWCDNVEGWGIVDDA